MTSPSPAQAVPPPVPPPTATRRRRHRLVAIATLALLAAAAAGAFPRWRARAALASETQELAATVVRVVAPALGQTPEPPPLPAELRPQAEAAIVARGTGYVRRWTTDIGDHVEAGVLLAELDSPELDQELARARQEVLQVEASLALATSTAERYRGLVATSGVSEQENAERQGDLALKTAALSAARANVRRLEELHHFTRLTAPFAGTITARRLDVGDLVTAGSGRELFRIAQTGTLRVSVRVPQSAARGVAVGQPAVVTVAELPGKVFSARVARTAGALSAESRTLLVELELPNPGGELLAGSFAEARLLGAAGPARLSVPSNALLFRQEGPRVGVVGAEGRVALRAVRLGRDLGKSVEVLEGVGASDRVILNPSDSLVDGATVRVAAEPPSGATR